MLAFFTLMEWSGHDATQLVHPLGYIRSGQWALDRELVSRAWQPLPHLTPLPRQLIIPLAITAAAWLSVIFWRGVEGLLRRRGNREGLPAAGERAVLRTRLLASFVAINTFFWFADPLQGLLGDNGGQVVRSLVLLLTSLGLYRAWGREPATYRRESTSDSLRRQLRDLPGLEPALDGRNLDALSPLEVFTLVKAMPAVGELQARRVYGEVLVDMLRSGRLDQAQSLLDLQELRQSRAAPKPAARRRRPPRGDRPAGQGASRAAGQEPLRTSKRRSAEGVGPDQSRGLPAAPWLHSV